MKNSARSTRVAVSADGRGLVSQAGSVLVWETMRVTGLGRGLPAGLARWRAPRAVHDPGKIVADLAAAYGSGSPDAGSGPTTSRPPSAACRPSPPADLPEPPLRPGKKTTRGRGTPPTRRESRAARHDPARKLPISRHPRPAHQLRERSRLVRIITHPVGGVMIRNDFEAVISGD